MGRALDREAARTLGRELRRAFDGAQIRLATDPIGDQPADDRLLEERVVLLYLRDDRILGDRASEDEAADQ